MNDNGCCRRRGVPERAVAVRCNRGELALISSRVHDCSEAMIVNARTQGVNTGPCIVCTAFEKWQNLHALYLNASALARCVTNDHCSKQRATGGRVARVVFCYMGMFIHFPRSTPKSEAGRVCV